jgi:flagellar biosynthetic protein FliQ
VNIDESTIEMIRTALVITLKVTAPILAAGVLVGLVISIFQSVTSIQDQTISLVPKIVVMLVVAILLAGWIIQRLVDYTAQLFSLQL